MSLTIDKPTKFWILANKDYIEGKDKQEVYQEYLEGVDEPLTINGLSVKIKLLLGLKPQYHKNKYIYLPDDFHLELPEKDFILGEETKDVYEFVQEMNSDIPFTQQELNTYLFRTYGLNYRQFKEDGKALYKYIEDK